MRSPHVQVLSLPLITIPTGRKLGLKTTSWLPRTGTTATSKPCVHPTLDPLASMDAKASMPLRARPHELTVRRWVPKPKRSATCAQEHVGVTAITRNGRVLPIQAKDGLPNPTVARRLTRSARLDETTSATRLRGDARTETRGCTPTASIQLVPSTSLRLKRILKATRDACRLPTSTPSQAPRHRDGTRQAPNLRRNGLLAIRAGVPASPT